MKKLLIVLTPVVIVIAVAGYYTYRGLMRRPAEAMVLPDFTELGPGPRAPSTSLFGVEVGRTMFAEIETFTKRAGLLCLDTSARALMKAARAQKKAERESKLARGEAIDAVSSASSGKKSPMEKNPQIRFSCEGSRSAQLTDVERVAAEGRVLFVIDSADHPLRHVSFRRNHTDRHAAWRDATATLARFTKRYGEPALVKLPIPDAPADDLFPKYTQSRYEWSFADLRVMLNVMGTPRGVDVLEAVEVPWPVRADAPTLPRVVERLAASGSSTTL